MNADKFSTVKIEYRKQNSEYGFYEFCILNSAFFKKIKPNKAKVAAIALRTNKL